MRGLGRSISILLAVVYLLSMSHTLFHHQMHQMLAHADEQVCNHLHHGDDCCCSGHCLDHKHSTPEEEKSCSASLQYLPPVSENLAPVHVVDLILPLCEELSIEQVDLAMELYSYMVDDLSQYYSAEISRNIPLRAPPRA